MQLELLRHQCTLHSKLLPQQGYLFCPHVRRCCVDFVQELKLYDSVIVKYLNYLCEQAKRRENSDKLWFRHYTRPLRNIWSSVLAFYYGGSSLDWSAAHDIKKKSYWIESARSKFYDLTNWAFCNNSITQNLFNCSIDQ